MAFQRILSQAYLKSNSIINDNVDFELLKPLIKAVQIFKIKPLLGTALYNRVVSESTPTAPNTFANLSPAIETLLDDYILDAMVWYVQGFSVPHFKFRFMNKGLMEKSSDNSQPASTDDLKFYEQRHFNVAENYGNQLQKYIRANQTLYPEFFQNSGQDAVFPDKTAFKCPIYLPGYTHGRKDYSNVRNPSDNPEWPD